MAADYIFVGNHDLNFEVPGTLGIVYNYKKWKNNFKGYHFLPQKNIYLKMRSLKNEYSLFKSFDLSEELKQKLKLDKTAILLIDTQNKNGIGTKKVYGRTN